MYGRRRRLTTALVIKIAALLAIGGVLALVVEPLLPDSFQSWITDQQARIVGQDRDRLTGADLPLPPGQQRLETYRLYEGGLFAAIGMTDYGLLSPGSELDERSFFTMRTWEGNDDVRIKFKPGIEPWVLQWDAKATSGLDTLFRIYETDKQIAEIFGVPGDQLNTSANYAIFRSSEIVTLVVEASGVEWKIRAGREPTADD